MEARAALTKWKILRLLSARTDKETFKGFRDELHDVETAIAAERSTNNALQLAQLTEGVASVAENVAVGTRTAERIAAMIAEEGGAERVCGNHAIMAGLAAKAGRNPRERDLSRTAQATLIESSVPEIY